MPNSQWILFGLSFSVDVGPNALRLYVGRPDDSGPFSRENECRLEVWDRDDDDGSANGSLRRMSERVKMPKITLFRGRKIKTAFLNDVITEKVASFFGE